MLTPVFELCQDDNFITITIKTPFARVSGDTHSEVRGCSAVEYRTHDLETFLSMTPQFNSAVFINACLYRQEVKISVNSLHA